MAGKPENQLRYQRSLGVERAWEHERSLVRQGRGTRQWTVKEQKELLRTGRVNGYHGHHMKSVKIAPEEASNPKNIQFLKARKDNNEHKAAHKGDYRNPSNGRYNIRTGKSRPFKDGKVRAMNSYELKEKAIEKPGYTKYDSSKVFSLKNTDKTSSQTTYTRSFVKAGKSDGKESVKVSSSEKASAVRYGTKVSSSPEPGKSSTGVSLYGARISSAGVSSGRGGSGGYGAKASGNSSAPSSSQGQGRSGGQSGGHSGGQSR